jgi:hypothetical protein
LRVGCMRTSSSSLPVIALVCSEVGREYRSSGFPGLDIQGLAPRRGRRGRTSRVDNVHSACAGGYDKKPRQDCRGLLGRWWAMLGELGTAWQRLSPRTACDRQPAALYLGTSSPWVSTSSVVPLGYVFPFNVICPPTTSIPSPGGNVSQVSSAPIADPARRVAPEVNL